MSLCFHFPVFTWIVLVTLYNTRNDVVVIASDVSVRREVVHDASSFHVATSHPDPKSLAGTDLCDIGGGIQVGTDIRDISKKLNSCFPILTSSDLGKKSPDVIVVHKVEMAHEANNGTDVYTCCSRLLASLLQHINSLCKRELGQSLGRHVCSLFDAGKIARQKHVMNEKYIPMKIFNHKIFKNLASFWDENSGQNETGVASSQMSNRHGRAATSDIADDTDVIDLLNGMAYIDTEVSGNDNYKTELIGEMSNVLKNVIASAVTGRDLSIESDASLYGSKLGAKKGYGSATPSKLATPQIRKRAKARPGFIPSYNQKIADDMTEEKMLAKLQMSSAECKMVSEYSYLALPGCVLKRVEFFRCQGSCSSWTVPESTSDSLVYRSKCSCCMPLRYKDTYVEVNCPGRRRGNASGLMRVEVPVPTKCLCRPCTNVSDVKHEQPYDY